MPDNQQQTQSDGKSQDQKQDQKQTQPVKFEEWIKGQSEEIKAAYDNHTNGLRSALATERTERGNLQQQLRDMAGKAEKGSEAQQKLTEMADKLSAMENQQDFYDQAHKLGVSDLKLAYLAAKSAGLIDANGRTNFDELKKLHPQLFSAPAGPKGNAGTGTGTQPSGKLDMNAVIRKAAGH